MLRFHQTDLRSIRFGLDLTTVLICRNLVGLVFFIKQGGDQDVLCLHVLHLFQQLYCAVNITAPPAGRLCRYMKRNRCFFLFFTWISHISSMCRCSETEPSRAGTKQQNGPGAASGHSDLLMCPKHWKHFVLQNICAHFIVKPLLIQRIYVI